VQTQYQAFSMVYIYTLYRHLEKDHIIIQANLIVSSVGILLSTWSIPPPLLMTTKSALL